MRNPGGEKKLDPSVGGKRSLDWEGAKIDRGPAQGEIWGQLSLDTVQGTSLRLAPKYSGGQRRHLVPAGATAGRRSVMAARAVYLSPTLGTTLPRGGIPSSHQEREVSGGTC